MPRPKRSETEGFLTITTVARRLGVQPQMLRSRIGSGALPPATNETPARVMLFDEAWVEAARQALADGAPVRRRRAASRVPSPASFLGYPLGTAGKVPGWGEIVAYFEALAAISDRVTVEALGSSTQGRPMIAVAVSAAENLTGPARERNRELLGRLWDPRDRAETELAEAIARARSVAVILATQHANEIGAALMTMELAHLLATGDDPETREVLSRTITLLIPSGNPDGIDIYGEWYGRWLGTEYEGCDLPWLYHPYVGHDNNRDWFMLTQVENQHFAAMHNREHPQLVFDMHQMGRDAARFMVPPFIDPLDPNQDPVIQQGFAAIGTAIAARLTAAGKPGVATHIVFDNYSPSLAYGNYHGSIDLLSEAASCRFATPVTVEEDDLRAGDGFDPRVRTWNHPLPWEGGNWSLRDILDYDLIAARAFLDHAAKYREGLLRDYLAINRRTIGRDEGPYGYAVPPVQHDPGAADELVETMILGAIEVAEAGGTVTLDGVTYPAGTRLIALDQPAGNFAKTLMETQTYPELRRWPDGPPIPPYDISGHTLPLQMGVEAVEVRQPIPAESREALRSLVAVPTRTGTVTGEGTWGWAFRPNANRSMLAARRLVRAGAQVHLAKARVPGLGLPPGSYLIPRPGDDATDIAGIVAGVGIDVVGLDGPVTVETLELSGTRLGVYQSWVASIDEGWARWVLDGYEVPYETLHDADVRQGDLHDRFDAILLPAQGGNDLRDGRPEKYANKEPNAPDYVGGLGAVGMNTLRRFVEGGGTLIASDGSASAVVEAFALPVRNVLAGLTESQFYGPGSLLRVVVDTEHPLGFGLPRQTTVLFLKGVAYDLTGVGTVVARYPQSDPSMSGWLLGPEHLYGKAAVVEVPLGEGKVVLFGCRPYFRAQARGTYKLLFNAINQAGSRPARLELGA